MSHALASRSRPTSSNVDQPQQDSQFSKQAQQATAYARARNIPAQVRTATVESYYERDDNIGDCNDCNSETECETSSEHDQIAKRAAEQAYKQQQQMYYQQPDVQYVPSAEWYYRPPSQIPYRYATTPAQTFVTPVPQMRKAHMLPKRQMPRVQAIPAGAMSPMQQYYQPYAMSQPSYDGMTYASCSTEGVASLPMVPIPGGTAYHQVQRHSTHQIPMPMVSNRLRATSMHATSAANIRGIGQPKKTITVHTPRYIRRPCASSPLNKKPSALCLPLACQPDPAVNPRKQSARATNDFMDHQQQDLKANRLHQQQQLNKRSSNKLSKMQSIKEQSANASLTAELQPTLSQSQLDALFANYEELYLKATTQGTIEQGQPKGKILATMMGLGPPRVPQHIQKRRQEILRAHKQQQQRQKKEQNQMANSHIQDRGDSKEPSNLTSKSFAIPKDAETFDVQKITSQVLQELMSDMNTGNEVTDADCGGLDDKISGNIADELMNDTDTTDCTNKNAEPLEKTLIDIHAPKRAKEHFPLSETLPDSFNYQDISQNISKSKSTFQVEEEDEDDDNDDENSTETLKQSTTASQSHLKSELDSQAGQLRRLQSQKSLKSVKSLKCSRVTNVAEAMELHRTKSYVVNLIDTALSNHFGTSVCDKYSSYECSGLNPANLIQTLKKHSAPKLEKDVCIEIAEALNQTYSNTCQDKRDCCVEDNNSKHESCCSCKVESGEPTYIKYLRQLRWGHLKHIQAEAKRLEELERFFDSCSKKAFCDKYP